MRSEPARTQQRIADLEEYMGLNVTGADGFCCSHESSCRASALINRSTGKQKPNVSFWRGQLSHVGHHYDVSENGNPWRVLILGMETGRARENVSLTDRRLEQQPVIRSEPRSRKPHMKGTASALRLAFGRTPGADRIGEMLNFANLNHPVHMMDAYALANVRLCSAVTTGTNSSKGTPMMTQNCSSHLEATVRILEPILIILQSGPAREQLGKVLSEVQRIAPHLEYVTIAGVAAYVASFTHPHQQGNNSVNNWGRSFSTPYLDEVVAPTLHIARSLALA
jgi:hypothetical protein